MTDKFITCWDILEIKPTLDVKIIKKAYSAKAILSHPEENCERFIELRRAYEEAILFSKINSLPFENDSNVRDNSHKTRDDQRKDKILNKSEMFDFKFADNDDLSSQEHYLNKVFIEDYFRKIMKNRDIAVNQIIYEEEFSQVIGNKKSVIYLIKKCYVFQKGTNAKNTKEIGTLIRLLERQWFSDKEVISILVKLENDSRWNQIEETENADYGLIFILLPFLPLFLFLIYQIITNNN
ncbi:hypothetical protein H9L01_04885 [Erysipelothrix inopinata]|uniref:J domain-containing protein n=1 Tax=Erysipelothrix inopinata TaxID=225084 RepID=A0A7G9S1G9_9FIRM|nr:hypothetical protein [Erysipelothrix inopinata]QNN61694.1 hypothetical protein H9L01_04885 [Erysipelothrix inopinata]